MYTDAFDAYEVLIRQAGLPMGDLTIKHFNSHSLTVEVKFRSYTTLYTFAGTEEDVDLLFLLYSNWQILKAGTTAMVNPQAMEVWKRRGEKGWSPDKLVGVARQENPILGMAGDYYERLALLCALGVEPKMEHAAASPRQIVNAYCLSKDFEDTTFDEALQMV